MKAAGVTVAIAQAESPEDPARAIACTDQWAGEARAAGAALVAFPETWIPGYPAWLDVCRDAALWDHPPVKRAYRRMAEHAVRVDGPEGEALGEIARRHEVVLVVGVVERVERGPGSGTLFNSLLVYDRDGARRLHHRKLVPTYTERMVWGPGDGGGLGSARTAAGQVGGLICWEHWMPLARHAMHLAGEDIHVALWPTVHEMHQVASRHYAFEGRCFVLACGGLQRATALPEGLETEPARVDSPLALVQRGGSAVIGPDGNYVVEPVFDEPALLVTTIDPGRCIEERMTLDVAGHYGRPDVFDFAVRSGRR